MKSFLLLTFSAFITACVAIPKTSPLEYRASVECTAILNLTIGLQQKDRNIPDADLASSRNAWIRKAALYDEFSQQQFSADVTKLGNAIVKQYDGQMTTKNLAPLTNRCLLR